MEEETRKSRVLSALVLLGALATASPAYANSQSGTTITMAGIENNGQQAFIGISPNPSACSYNGVYFTVPAEVNKTLAVALMAKASGKTVRIDLANLEAPERYARAGISGSSREYVRSLQSICAPIARRTAAGSASLHGS